MYKLTSEMQLKPVDISNDDVSQFSDGAIVISTDGIIYRAESNAYTVLLDPSNISDLSDYYTKGQVDGFLGPINATNVTQTGNITSNSQDISALESQLGTQTPEYNDISQTANIAYSLSQTNNSALVTLSSTVSTNQTNITSLTTTVTDNNGDISELQGQQGSRSTWQSYTDGHRYAQNLPIDIKSSSNLIAWKYCSANTGSFLSKGYTYDHHFAYLDINSYNAAANPEVIYFPNDYLSDDIQGGLKPGFRCRIYNVTNGASVKVWNDDAGEPRFRLLSDANEVDLDQFFMTTGSTWEISYCVGQATQEIPTGGSIIVEVPFWLVHRIN